MKKGKILRVGLLVLCGLMLFQTLWSAPLTIKEISVRDQQLVLDEVNKHRLSKGLKPLKLNKYMSMEATQHSRDMANKMMAFGHEDFDKRIKRIYEEIQFCRAGAENIAYFKIPPREVVHKWLTSPGHRRNIEGNFNLTGIGIAQDKNGWTYYTQIFLRTENPEFTR